MIELSDRKGKMKRECCELFRLETIVFVGCAADKMVDEKA